jgi:hypothetical protein
MAYLWSLQLLVQVLKPAAAAAVVQQLVTTRSWAVTSAMM